MDFDASRPIWLRLREEFTKRVVIGRWAPGKQIPGVRELMAELGVDSNTIQQTFTELERDGLRRSEGAMGRFVTDDAERVSWFWYDPAMEAADELITQMRGSGLPEVKTVTLIAER